MNLIDTNAAPIVQKLGDSDVEFRRLTIYDFATLAEKLHAKYREEAPDNLRILSANGVKPNQMPMVIHELVKRPSNNEVRRWIYTMEGTIETLRVSGDLSDEQIRSITDDLGAQELALRVAGLWVSDVEESSGTIPLSKDSTETGVTGSTNSASSPTSTQPSETHAV